MTASKVDSTRISRRAMLQRLGIVGAGAGIVGLGAGVGIGNATAGSDDTAATAATGVSGSDRTFKIGGSYPLTDFAAADGLEQRQAVQLAIDEWNERGGVLGMKIELTVQDVGNMAPENMITTFRDLVDKEKVDVIVNGYLLYSGPEFDIVAAGDNPVPYFHANTLQSSVDKVKENREKYWMIYQGDSPSTYYGLGFPPFLKAMEEAGLLKARNRSVAIIYANDPYNKSIADNLRKALPKAGWKATMVEQVVAPVRDWGPTLSKVRAEDPDAVFLADLVLADAAGFTKQFVQNPTRSLLYEQYIPSLPAYQQLVGDAAEGVTWATLAGITPAEAGVAFKARYEKRWGSLPGETIGGVMYDMTNLYLTAVTLVGDPDDRRKIVKTASEMSWAGVSNIMRFNSDQFTPAYPSVIDRPDGQLHTFFQIQGGEQKRVYPEPFTESKYRTPPWA
jgi:branched-chain amino acid transport system substrate-binding protein